MKVHITVKKDFQGFAGGSSGGGSGKTYKSSVPAFQTVSTRYRNETVTVQGTPPPPPSFALPTAQTGILVPYLVGLQKVASPNIIWYGNMQTRYATRREVKSVEQEEFRTITVTPGHQDVVRDIVTTTVIEEVTYIEGYTIDIQMGIALGPGCRLKQIQVNNTPVWDGDIASGTIPNSELSGESEGFIKGDITFYGGAFDQVPNAHIQAHEANEVPGYVGIAYVLIRDVEMTVGYPPTAFLVERFPNPMGLDTGVNRMGDDINPMTALIDFCTTSWGGGGVPISRFNVASFSAAATRLRSEENMCALFVQQETMLSGVIQILQAQVRGFMYDNPETGLIDFILVREDTLDMEDLVVLDETNVTEPRGFTKPLWGDIPSQMRVTFTDRAQDYGRGVAIAQNSSVVSSSKTPVSLTTDYPAVMNKALASLLAARDLSLASVPNPVLELQLNRSGALLVPGQIVRWSWAEWNIVDLPLRILKRRDHPKNSNQVTVIAEQYRINRAATFAVPEDSQANTFDTSAVAPSAVAIKTAPYWLMRKAGFSGSPTGFIDTVFPMMFATRANASQVGFDAYIENVPGGTGDILARSTMSYATVASLNADLNQYQDVADGIIASVDIDGVNNTAHLYDIGNSGVRSGRILMFIGDEIFSFESVTNLGGGSWRLNNVHRALIDTAPTAHPAGAPVYIVSNTYDWISPTTHRPSSDYIPEWRLVGRSLNRVQRVANGLFFDGWAPGERPNNPYRPHNFKIDGSARSATPKALTKGNNYDITWAVRSRANILSIALMLDDTEALEFDGAPQKHRVFLRDSANDVWDLGVTTGSGDDTELTVTIPSGAASGVGVMWVRAETSHGVSMFNDYLPVTLS